MFHQFDQAIELIEHNVAGLHGLLSSHESSTSHEPAIKTDDRTEQYHNELLTEHRKSLGIIVGGKRIKFLLNFKKKYDDNGFFTPEYSQLLLLFSHVNWNDLTAEEIIPLHEIVTGRKWTLHEMENNRNMLEKEKEEEDRLKNNEVYPELNELFLGMNFMRKLFN